MNALTVPVSAAAAVTAAPYRETRDRSAPFDGDREIVEREDQARRLARTFKSARKYPLETAELESEAILALTEAARDFPDDPTPLPFGAFATQRILWRLEDFIQAWYRLARCDYNTGRDEVRRVVGLSLVEGMEGRPVGPRSAAGAADINTGLYIEDCKRLVDTVLTPRAKTVLDLKYRGHKSLKKIASELGLTHVRARQIHSEALAALRAAMNGGEEPGAESDETADSE